MPFFYVPDCSFYSPLQHLNIAVHGDEYKKKLKKCRKKTFKMIDLAINFLEVAIKNHGRIAVEWQEVAVSGNGSLG